MIDKGKLIENALLRLGNISDYNDDRSRTYIACSTLIPSIIKKTCSNNSLNFAVSKVVLTTHNFDEESGEYIFNLPADFLGIAKRPIKRRIVSNRIISALNEISYSSNSTNVRLQGEYIYSNRSKISLYYTRELPITEFPDYMFDYLVWTLATEACLMYPAFTERLGYCETKASQALLSIQKLEGFGVAYE